MLQNAYFHAKIGADTAENEQHFAEILPKIGNYPTGPAGYAGIRVTRRYDKLRELRSTGFSKDGQTECKLMGSVKESAKSTAGFRCIRCCRRALLKRILTGLVLGCIEADFCDQIFVGKLSPRSTS